MSAYRVSFAARGDLKAIARYTAQKWGLKQRIQYLAEIKTCFKMLADQPEIGIVHIASPGFRNFHHRSHVVYYTLHTDHILIVRVLHERQDPSRHLPG